MGTHIDQRERTLTIAQILQVETDEKHPMPLSVLCARLSELGISAERKSIYRDLAALRRHGLDVVFRPGVEGGWYVEHRTFDLPDLRVLIDAVSVYRWLDPDHREALVEKLSGMGSCHQKQNLRRPVAVCPRSALEPVELQRILDRIHAAIQSDRAISFAPVTYDMAKHKATGPRLTISPKGLLWCDETYQLLAWDHRAQTLRLFRPDRMADLLITGLPAQGPEAQPELSPFGGDTSRRDRLRLRCSQALAGEVLDRFGPDVNLVPEGDRFVLTTEVVVSEEFWGWMAAHSDQADVIAPPWATKVWREHYQPKEPTKVRRPFAV